MQPSVGNTKIVPRAFPQAEKQHANIRPPGGGAYFPNIDRFETAVFEEPILALFLRLENHGLDGGVPGVLRHKRGRFPVTGKEHEGERAAPEPRFQIFRPDGLLAVAVLPDEQPRIREAAVLRRNGPEQRGADRHPCDTQRQLRRILCAAYLCADGHETAEVNGAVAEHRNVNIKRWILPVDHAARRDHRHVVKETSHQTGIGRPAVQPSFRHQQNDGHGKVGGRGEFDREDNLSCYTGTFSTFMPDADAPVYVLADGACYEACPTEDGFQLLISPCESLTVYTVSGGEAICFQAVLSDANP